MFATPPWARPNSASYPVVMTSNSLIESCVKRSSAPPFTGSLFSAPSTRYDTAPARSPKISTLAPVDKFGSGRAPGTSAIRSVKLRPFSGSASMVRCVTVFVMSDRVTCTSGASAETCTDSDTPPTASVKSSVVT